MNNGLELYLAYMNSLRRDEYFKEVNEKDYKPFENYGNQEKPNLSRSIDTHKDIDKKGHMIWALAACLHRERDNGEDNKLEQEDIKTSLTIQEQEIAEVLSWWSD